MYKYTYPFQLAFVHSDLTSLQCKESMQNFSPVAIDIFPPNVLVRFISNTQDFSSAPLEHVNWKLVVLLNCIFLITTTFQWKAYLKSYNDHWKWTFKWLHCFSMLWGFWDHLRIFICIFIFLFLFARCFSWWRRADLPFAVRNNDFFSL